MLTAAHSVESQHCTRLKTSCAESAPAALVHLSLHNLILVYLSLVPRHS